MRDPVLSRACVRSLEIIVLNAKFDTYPMRKGDVNPRNYGFCSR